MPKDAYVLERLVVTVVGQERRPGTEPSVDHVSIDLTFKNPLGSPGSTRRPPNMELKDAEGRFYPVLNADWAEPILPDTEMSTRAEFDVADSAVELALVFAPGESDEVTIDLSAA